MFRRTALVYRLRYGKISPDCNVMKILLISPRDGVVGGISMWTKHITNYLSTSKDVSISLCDFSRQISGQVINNPLKRWYCAIRDYIQLTYIAIKKINTFNGDIVHLCSSASYLLIKDVIILRAARRKGLKTYIHFHFGRIPQLSQKRNWEWKLLKIVIRNADNVILMDKASYSTLEQLGYSHIDIVPNPIADETIQIIEKIKRKREDRTILFAGHCIPTKGIFELIRVCKQIPDIKLKLIGAISNEMQQTLKKMVAGGNEEWIEIKGQISYLNTIEEMKACDIFVLPSYTEGFPNVILESMACGCPIIATKVGAITEMLEEEQGKHYGILIDPKDEMQLNKAISLLLSDKELKTECGENARNRVISKYNIRSISNQLIKIWQN